MLKQLSYSGLIGLLLIGLMSCFEPSACSDSFISNDTDNRIAIIAYSYQSVDTFAILAPRTKSLVFRKCNRGDLKFPRTAFGEVWQLPDSIDVLFDGIRYLRYFKAQDCALISPLCSHNYLLVSEEGSLGFFEYRITQEDFEAAKPF